MEFVEAKICARCGNRCAQKGIAFPLPVAAHIVRSWCGAAYAHSFEGLRLVHLPRIATQRAAFLFG